jgi:hypothetical protein
MTRARWSVVLNQSSTSSMVVISASKAVCLTHRDLLPWATESPRPSALVVMIYPRPADTLKEPSVQAWYVANGF